MSEEIWVLCISQMPGSENATVKVLSSQDVPVEGEQLTILGQFARAESANSVRNKFGDAQIINYWQRGYTLCFGPYFDKKSPSRKDGSSI